MYLTGTCHSAGSGALQVLRETFLTGKLLWALYTACSDRQLAARLQTDFMFHRFLDLPPDEPPFDASTCSKNQQRLLRHKVADLFFPEVVNLARRHGWSPTTNSWRMAP